MGNPKVFLMVTPVSAPTTKTALLLGIFALVLPAFSVAIIWAGNLDKDYGLIVYGLTVALTIPSALVAAGLALWRSRPGTSPAEGRWQAWMGLLMALLAVCVYVVGGGVFLFLMYTVLRHD